MGAWIFIAVMLVLLWVLVIAPQRRRQQAQKRLFEELTVGDEVLTAGGLYGTLLEVDGDRLVVKIAPGTNVRLDLRAIAGIVEDEGLAEGDGDGDLGADALEPEPDALERHEEPSRAERT